MLSTLDNLLCSVFELIFEIEHAGRPLGRYYYGGCQGFSLRPRSQLYIHLWGMIGVGYRKTRDNHTKFEIIEIESNECKTTGTNQKRFLNQQIVEATPRAAAALCIHLLSTIQKKRMQRRGGPRAITATLRFCCGTLAPFCRRGEIRFVGL